MNEAAQTRTFDAEGIGRLLDFLVRDVDIAALVRGRLETCLDLGRAPGADHGTRLALLDLASHELHHLALENAVVLPIAACQAGLRRPSRGRTVRRGP